MADRLASEPSPYLQQHADNPVDWWPWCDQAFEEARRRDVPVFLSIGYSTCHWCHVMAHESFEDEEVAALLNQNMVCIKVDREERPDVDAAYMAACQAMTGRGGWPLTCLLDHQRRPWFAGTYLPKQTVGQRLGLLDFVPRAMESWTGQREEVTAQGAHIQEHLAEPETAPGEPDDAWLSAAHQALQGSFDDVHGGFGHAPKFPSPHQLRLLLRLHHRGQPGLQMVTKTLDGLAAGGIHDHVGGGFHRYATDAEWRLPHFEKMLYDQANLLEAFTDAWQVTHDQRYADVAADIVGYVLRDLRHPSGGLSSAEDADSEGEEGAFYVWTRQQIEDALGEDAPGFMASFDVRKEGNFHDEATGHPVAKNVLHRTDGHPAGDALERLRLIRAERPRPMRDDKVLADWNGLFIAALARAGAAFGERSWVDAAIEAGRFVRDEMCPDGHPRHVWQGGRLGEASFLDDLAACGLAWIALYEATGDPEWLRAAGPVVRRMVDAHGAPGGGFLTGAQDGERLIVARRDTSDGASASGNSLAVDLLWRFARITGEPDWEELAWQTVRSLASQIERYPTGFTHMLGTLSDMMDGGQEIVLAGDDGGAMLQEIHSRYLPGTRLLVTRPGLEQVAPWTADHAPAAGGGRAYVCQDHACKAPVESVAGLREALATASAGPVAEPSP